MWMSMLANYLPILMFLGVATALATVLMVLGFFLGHLGVRQRGDAQKLSPYECGFEAFEDMRARFDREFKAADKDGDGALTQAEMEAGMPLIAADWGLPTALSLLAWYVFAPQCLSTLAVVRRETNGWRWPLVMTAYLFGLAYLASFVTYRVALAWGH